MSQDEDKILTYILENNNKKNFPEKFFEKFNPTNNLDKKISLVKFYDKITSFNNLKNEFRILVLIFFQKQYQKKKKK